MELTFEVNIDLPFVLEALFQQLNLSDCVSFSNDNTKDNCTFSKLNLAFQLVPDHLQLDHIL